MAKVGECKATEKEKEYERHFRNCWQNMQLCKFVSMYVCVCGEVSCILLKLIFLAANALVPSILLLLYVVAALLCLSHLRPSFFFFVQSPLPLAPMGILHSQLIRIFVCK